MASAILRGADLPPGTEGSAPPDSELRKDLADIQTRISRDREAGKLRSGYDGLDLTKHNREEVLAYVESFIANLRPLQEAEEAHKRGVFAARGIGLAEVIREIGLAEVTRDPLSLYAVLPDALAYRAILEAHRGDIEKAVASCSDACGMSCRVSEAQGDLLARAPAWYVRFMADVAWKKRPLTQEQRERLISSLVPRIAPERMPEVMLRRVAESHRSTQEFAEMVRATSFSRILMRPVCSALGVCFEAQVDFCARRLYPLLTQSSRPTATEIDRALSTPFFPPSSFTAQARSLASEVADDTVKAARNNCMPDVVRAFFALKDYQRAHGEYPKALDGLCPAPIPALPDDPVSGGPMIYESDGKTFTISSRPMALPPDASDLVKRHVKWVNEHLLMWKAWE